MPASFSHDADNTEIRIRFPYNEKLVFEVKQIPGRRFHKEEAGGYWSIPMTSTVVAGLRNFAEAAGVPLPEGIVELIAGLEAERKVNLDLSQSGEARPVAALPEVIAKSLKPFQHAGVQYILNNRRVLLGDDMGLGKTLQALAALEAMGAYPALVVTPASLKYNWRREIAKWLPDRLDHVLILNGGDVSQQDRGAHIVIVNYDILKRHQWLWSMNWKTVIVDESHYIKNEKSQRTNFVLDIVKDVPNVILLSGTPILNRPIELASQLKAIRRLDSVFGGFWPFAHRYCEATKGDYGWILDGASNLEELNRKLRENCYIRRDKKSVLPELPDKTRSILPVDIDNRPEYNKARDELIAYIREQGRLSKKFLEELEEEIAEAHPENAEEYRGRRISEYRQDKAQRAARAETLVRIETLKQVTARGKHAQVKDWIKDFFDQNPSEKVVIFATHKDVIEAITKDLTEQYTTPLVLTGDTPAEERDRLVNLFQTDPEIRVFLANIQAGGVGLTLTAASYVLFVEFGWNSATMDQAEDRCYRIGQKNAVSVYWMVGRNTLDEYLVDMIESKREVVERATDGGSVIEMISAYLTQSEVTK